MSEQSKKHALMMGTIIYAIGTFGTKILSFLIVPLYTYYIAPSEMGDYDLLNTTISLLTPLVTLQISDGAYVWMMRNKDKTEDYITAVYKFVITTTLFAAFIIFIIDSIFGIPYATYFTLLLLTGRWFQTLQKLLRGLKNQKLFAFSGVLYTTIFLILNLVQIVVLKMKVDALFQSAIIANAVCIGFVLIFEKRLRINKIKEKSIQTQIDMLRFSVPLIPNRLNWWIINSSGRYIVRIFLGSAANGIYAIAYKFPSLLQMIYNIFYESWQDMAVADNDEDVSGFYSSVFRKWYKLSFTFLLFLIPFTKVFIRLVMSDAYISSADYISFLYLGTVFQAFSSFFGVGYLKNNKTFNAATTSIYGALVNIVINIILINFIGLYATSIATFVGFFVMFAVRIRQTRDTMKVKVNWLEFVLLFIMALVIVIIGAFSNIRLDFVMTILGLFLFVVLNLSELKLIVSIILKKVKKK